MIKMEQTGESIDSAQVSMIRVPVLLAWAMYKIEWMQNGRWSPEKSVE